MRSMPMSAARRPMAIAAEAIGTSTRHGRRTCSPAAPSFQQERRGHQQQDPADQAHRQRHRGEGQHAHVDPGFGGDPRDQQVRTGTDERDGADQRRRVSDRQQHLPCRD